MEIKEMLLTPNNFSRPKTALKKVTNIIIHWVGNAGSTGVANRNYFESLKNGKTYASSHYIIGLEGEVIRCVPENEIAYHANAANDYSIGIENCHPDWNGKFNDKTYASLITLCAMLCKKYDLNPEKALLRHYDITKKLCPKYYVEHQEAWLKLKADVKEKLASEEKEKEQDTVLIQALIGMANFGIVLDVKMWGNTNTMNMKYATLMVEKIGLKFGMKGYEDTINFLIKQGCINTPQIWIEKKFESKWCRALIIKVYDKLIKK